MKGITIETEDGKDAGLSSAAAIAAICQVIPSRIGMAVPGMMIPPLVMNSLEKSATFIKSPWLKAPTTVSTTSPRSFIERSSLLLMLKNVSHPLFLFGCLLAIFFLLC